MTLQRTPSILDLTALAQNVMIGPAIAFHHAAVENGWTGLAVRDTLIDRPVDPETFDLGKTIQSAFGRRDTMRNWTIIADTCIYLIRLEAYGELWSVTVHVAAATGMQARELALATLGKFPPRAVLRDDTVRVAFWALGKNGPYYKSRKIEAPSWEEIEGNYAAPTRTALAQAMRITPPVKGGQLLLFHGEPGTGKTWAIRALIREWKPWCHTSYIVDPDRFFSLAEYMLTVTLDATDELRETIGDDEEGGPPTWRDIQRRKQRTEEKQWHLLVVEDADDFVGVDAKSRTGQSLGRLLNIVDGLVGQGLRVLVLLTANEQVGRMHPALTRTGRCIANIDFTDLSPEEVGAWGERHEVTVPQQRMKLNALYALARAPESVQVDGVKPGVVP